MPTHHEQERSEVEEKVAARNQEAREQRASILATLKSNRQDNDKTPVRLGL
jgi:hypothetical protein